MDFKKIWEGSKIPVYAILALAIIGTFATAVIPQSILFWILTLLRIGICFWLGYNGVKKFNFDYADAAVGGALFGIATVIIGFGIGLLLIIGQLSPYASQLPALTGMRGLEGSAMTAAIISYFIGTVFATVLAIIIWSIVSLISAVIAKFIK